MNENRNEKVEEAEFFRDYIETYVEQIVSAVERFREREILLSEELKAIYLEELWSKW